MTASFLDALGADGPAADRAGKMDLYGWLIGAWALDVTRYPEGGEPQRRKGEWHFGWVLEGRAIQDVWIVPPRGARHGDTAANRNSYGCTLRIYDPAIDAWQIQWTDPVAQNFCSMIGRKEGTDIVQLGRDAAGHAIRWRFLDITPDAFLWRGEISRDDGATWRREVEFFATRTG
jgi:hypothetical protein